MYDSIHECISLPLPHVYDSTMSLQFCISCRFITSVCKPQAPLQFYSRIECDTHMKHHETRETHTNVGFTARSSGAPTKCAMRPILWDIEEISTFLDYSEPLRTSTLHKILGVTAELTGGSQRA